MKKFQLILLTIFLFILVGCTTRIQEETKSMDTTNNTDSTVITTQFVDHFTDHDYIRHINLDDEILGMIESNPIIAYIDEELYVYYDSDLNASSFFVSSLGELSEYDTNISMAYNDFFIMNYDMENDVLYYHNNNSIRTIPSNIDEEINLYASSFKDIKYFNSEYLLVENEFISFRGERLFSDGGTVVYPEIGINRSLRFYTYQSDKTQDEACMIKTYNGFQDTPEETLVHEEYTCSSEYVIRNDYVIIELIDFISPAGFVSISPAGEINVFDLAQEVPDFVSVVFDSYQIMDSLVYFKYEDTDELEHYVTVDFNSSSITYDEMSSSMAEKTIYSEDGFRFYKYSNAEYHIYIDGEKFYTYTPLDSSNTAISYFSFGDYGVIIESGYFTPDGRITRVDLNDASTVSHNILSPNGYLAKGNSLLLSCNGEMQMYNVSNDSFTSLEVFGTVMEVNDDYTIIYSDDYVYLLDFSDLSIIQMNRIGEFRKTLQPYAFVVEYEDEYYIIG